MLREAQAELGFELQLVEIDGDAELEPRYRERIPVVEIDGEQAFTYFVEPDALRRAPGGSFDGGRAATGRIVTICHKVGDARGASWRSG